MWPGFCIGSYALIMASGPDQRSELIKHAWHWLSLSYMTAWIILRIINYKFGENNAGIIGYLQA